MKDLTHGSIPRHVAAMALPLAGSMLVQTLYFFVDLYFVARLGPAALAGVGAAGNAVFAVFALTQTLGVGTVAMVSHAVGRKDRGEANHVFNQSVALGMACIAITLAGGYAIAGPYMREFAADAASAAAGIAFLHAYLPGLALQFAIVVMSSGLRGTGVVKAPTMAQAASVLVNVALAPVLIAGWGTGHAYGVTGAGLASSLATLAGFVMIAIYFLRLERYVAFHPAQWRPRPRTWLRMLDIGLPAGGEFAMMAVVTAVMYWTIRDFGAAAQAGYNVGARINQMFFLPAMAVSFAAAPIAGQNFGARRFERVRATFRTCLGYGMVLMVVLLSLVQWKAETLAQFFTADAGVIAVASEFLRYISWNFVSAGIIFTCSAMFQAMGNTWPTFASSALRLVTFAASALWIAARPGFELADVFRLSIVSTALQALVSYAWLRLEFRGRLGLDDAGLAARSPSPP